MEPKDFARVILRRKRTVITALVVVLLTAGFGSYRKVVQYVAACDVLFQATAYDPTDPSSKPIETIGTFQSNAEFLKSPRMAHIAAESMKVPVETIAGKLAVEISDVTQIFKLQVVDSEPARAGQICNGYAQAYREYKISEAERELKSLKERNELALRETEKELYRIYDDFAEAVRTGDPRQIDLAVQRDTLLKERSERRQDLEQISNMLKSGINGGGELIRPAGDGVPTGGDHKRDLLLGLIVGLMFGVGLALVREYLDDTVKDKESTQRELGLPVLATLPSDSIDGLEEPTSGVIEAARTLRATLSQLGVPHDKNCLVVTSTLAKSRSTTLSSLAGAFAEAGRSVLVIGSDLRGGRTHDAFGIANTAGLANVVRGQVSFEKAIRPAPGLAGVYVIPSGPLIANPGEVLSSEEMAMVIRRARRWADVVLLDAPPVLAAADASVLGAYADGVLLVVSAGQTNRSHANEAKEQLVAAGARVMGAVLVGVDDVATRGGSGGGYGDDLAQVLPYGDWNDAYGSSYGYDDYEGYDDDGYGDPVLTATVRTEPRARTQRPRPSKKVSASRAGQRPTPRRATPSEPAVPRNARSARASGGSARASGDSSRSASTSRKPANGARKPANGTRATANGTRKPANGTRATANGARKAPARGASTTRSTGARRTAQAPSRKATTAKGTTRRSR